MAKKAYRIRNWCKYNKAFIQKCICAHGNARVLRVVKDKNLPAVLRTATLFFKEGDQFLIYATTPFKFGEQGQPMPVRASLLKLYSDL